MLTQLIEICHHYKVDLSSPKTFKQEIMLWRQTWANEAKPALPSTIPLNLCLTKTCDLMFPNITTTLKLLLLTPVTSSGVERAITQVSDESKTASEAQWEDIVSTV